MTTTKAEATTELSRVQFRDLSAVAQLERRCFGLEAWGWLDFLMCLTPGNLFIKATQAGRMVGFILAQPNRRNGVTWITNVAVDPTRRNQGIGRRLMQAIEAQAATPRLKLTVRVDNDAARHLYRSLGYTDVVLRRGYYSGYMDGMEMEKILGG